MKRALLIFLGCAGFIALLVIKGRTATPANSLSGSAMGTQWSLQWRGSPPPELRREVAGVLEHWEQVLSQWRENSDLSRHNRGEPATPELARVIARAEEMRIASGGAFDHRILERVHAAGFGPAGQGIDLSAIGKGFAVDRVDERLRQLDLTDFIFELGGDLIAGDGSWAVEIERPLAGGQEISHQVMLRGRALATSGNYRQFVGSKSHLIDPRTGQPVERPPCSVTVTAADCATADAWATALFVLGPEFADLPAVIEVRWQDE